MKQRSYETKNDEFVNTGFVRKQKNEYWTDYQFWR